MPELTPEQKAQLDKNIRSMLSQGASQDDVTNYANDFKLKYDTELKKKGSVSDGVGNTTASNGLSGGRLGKSATNDPDRLYQAMVKQSHSGTPQQQPITEKVEIDYKDPIGSQLRPIKERQKQLQDLRRGVESVEQNTAQKLGYSNEITGLAKQESNLLSQRFGHSAEAQGFVEDMLDKSKLRLKPGKEMAFPNVPTLDDFTEESIIEASPKGNATFNIAVDQVRRNKEVKDALATSTTLGDAAVKRAMAKRTLQGRQATELSGDIPNSMKGAMLIDFLNDPDFQEAAAENPLLAKQAEREAKELPKNFPDAAIRIIAQAVSAERERKGMNSAILNNPSIKNSEEIVNELVEKGELPEQYKDFYSNPAVKFAVNFKLKTPGLVENFGSGIEQGITGMGKSVADLTQVRKLYSSKDDRLFKTLEKDYENFALKPKGLLHNITTYGGNILGQIVPMVGGGMAARGVGLIKGENTANAVMTGLQTWGENRDRALADLPGASEGEQFGYATINTGIEVSLANILNDTKLARQLIKGTSPEVKTIISKFTSKEITAAVAKQEINNVFSKALAVGGRFAKGVIKTADKEAREEAATQILQTATNQAFGGEPQSVSQQMSDAFEVYTTTFLGSLVPGAGGGVVELNRNPEMGKLVFEMASNPEKYVDIMKGQAAIDPEYAKDIDQKVENLQYLVTIKSALDRKKDMSEDKKAKVMLKSLSQKVLQDDAASVPDKSLIDNKKQIDELEIEKQMTLNPNLSNTEVVKMFYDKDILPKGSMNTLEGGEKKFNEANVGMYLKEVAQQSNNLDENWKPHDTEKPASLENTPIAIIELANKRWGKEIEAAKKLFPQENPPIDQVREMADENTPTEVVSESEAGSVGVGGDVGRKPIGDGRFVRYNPNDVLPLLPDYKPTNTVAVEDYVNQVVPNDASVEAYKTVPLDAIQTSEKIESKDRKAIDKIKEGIKNGDDIPPLVLDFSPVIKNGETYKFALMDGHHRYIAYKELGIKEVAAAIVTSREHYTFETNDTNIKTLFEQSLKEQPKDPSLSSNTPSKPEVSENPALKDVKETPEDFYKKYKGVHFDIRGGRDNKTAENKKSIQDNGFNEAFNVNALPLTEERNSSTKKGQVLYLVPKEGLKDSDNGYKVKKGWKPNDAEVVTIEYDGQSIHEAYLNNANKISDPSLSFNTPSKETPKAGSVGVGGVLRKNGFVESKNGGLEKDGIRIVVSEGAALGLDQSGDVINVISSNPKDIVLKEINVVDEAARGKGNATQVLRDFLAAADEAGNTIFIEPSPIAKFKNKDNLTEQQLINWYERHGFEKMNDQVWRRKQNAKLNENESNYDYENRLTYEEADSYRDAIAKGEMTVERVIKAIEDSGFIVPKDIREAAQTPSPKEGEQAPQPQSSKVTEANETTNPQPNKENKQSNQPTEKESKPTQRVDEKGDDSANLPPKEPSVGEGEDGGGSGITHAANEVRRMDRALPEYQKSPQTFEEWNNEAEKAIKDGYDVEKLMNKIEAGHDPTPVENAIRKIYIATLDAEIAKNPTDELLAKQKRFIEIGDLANSRAGRNLVSLKGEGSPLSSISDFYVAKMEAAGVDRLTDQQKKETKEAFDNVQKADANATAAMEAYREEIAQLKAENELLRQKKEAKKSTSPKTKEEFVAQRKTLKDKLKQQLEELKAEGQKMGIASDGGFGSMIITAKMAKTIGEIAKSHVDEIGVNLKEVVRKTFEDIKDLIDGISEKDIHDVLAGEYNEVRPTRNELAAKMRDLKDEAYYINKLDRLVNGKEPKKEREKVKRNKQITELQQKIKDLQKELPPTDAELKRRLTAIKTKNENEAIKIKERISKGDFEAKKKVPFLEDPEMQRKFPKEYKAALDAIVAREDARHEFDIALMKDQMAKRNLGKKGVDLVGDIIGTTKALVTGIDASGIGIQNLVAMIAHPRSAAKALPLSFTDFISAKNQDRWLASVHNSELFPLAKKAGLDITEPKSLKASEREDMYTHNLLDRTIKYKGKKYIISKYITKPFERIFTGLGNRMRWNLWQRGVDKLYNDGFTWESHPEEFKALAKVLNTETGRGSLHPQVDKAFNLVSAGIWSPRLMASRMNILGLGDIGNMLAGGNKGYYGGLTPRMRAYALRDVAKFIVFGTLMMGLAGLAFADDVDLDPNSSTFGTFSVNGKRYNIWGGFTQYVRLIAKLIAGGEKKTDGTFAESNQLKTSLRFLWSKTTPAVGTGISLLNKNNADYMGKPVTGMGALENLTIPLSIRGIAKGVDREGWGSVIWTGIPSFVGVNVNYESDFNNNDGSKPKRPKIERPKPQKISRE